MTLPWMFKKIFQRKSEIIMFIAGLCILSSVIMVATTGNFIFWKFAKFFYFGGIFFILFDN
ncbi:MAG: hypothetical protein KBC22_00290 [Candidatus Pacebacteria bacterium]|nr:hypothetical protein [Candidatus Paceibacterota bacterium]